MYQLTVGSFPPATFARRDDAFDAMNRAIHTHHPCELTDLSTGNILDTFTPHQIQVTCPVCTHTYQDDPDVPGFQTWRFCPECSSTIPPKPKVYTGRTFRQGDSIETDPDADDWTAN